MDKYKDNGILLMKSDLVKYCKEVVSMGGDTDITLFNTIYNDISEKFGIDVAIHMYENYRGLQVTFPTRLFNSDYVKAKIPLEYDGKNIKQLAKKYGYSEKSIRRILKEKTQLIVNESQEAILFKGGQALDVFGAGRHTLTTNNIPILSKLINLPFGGVSPFTAEVWYVNKIHSLDIKWGTITPISLFDPFLMIDVKVKSFGQFGIRINNSKKFLEKLVGTLPVFSKDNVIAYFRGEYLKKCTAIISSYFTQKNIGILQVNTYLDDLSDYIKDYMSEFMDDYGISLITFSVNNISADENDESYKAVKEAMAGAAKMRWSETAKADTAAYSTRTVGTAKADVMGYEQQKAGYTYQQKRSFDVMESAASNESGTHNE